MIVLHQPYYWLQPIPVTAIIPITQQLVIRSLYGLMPVKDSGPEWGIGLHIFLAVGTTNRA